MLAAHPSRQVEIEDDLVGLLVQFRDVSDEVAIEDAAARKRMLEHAGRYNAMGEMASVIAHELSQPLAAVRNFIEGAVQRLNARGAIDDAIWGCAARTGRPSMRR